MTTARLRKSTRFFIITGLQAAILIGLGLHAASGSRQAPAREAENAALARELRLTDLCIFTEARYTRHPAMADRHAPFQEHPSAFEHFPSGSLLQPPALPTGASHAQH
jgi:hypothetical protein